ncbi:MAG: hypothetical protein AB1757_21220 [Acidobacteriota bacterium]
MKKHHEFYAEEISATNWTAKQIAQGEGDFTEEIQQHAQYLINSDEKIRASFYFVKQYSSSDAEEFGAPYEGATLWALDNSTVTVRRSNLQN